MDFDKIKKELEQALSVAADLKQVEEVRIRFLGKKGSIADLRKNVDFKSLSTDEKKDFGRNFNDLKDCAEEQVKQASGKLKNRNEKLPGIDMTLPGTQRSLGCLHPITIVQIEL